MKILHPRKSIRGNALWFILIAIFLLAALTMLITRTSSQTEETGDAERASITAGNILRKASSLATTYDRLIMNGCSENTISFNYDRNGNGVLDDLYYYNDDAPSDFSCHIFHAKGGGMDHKQYFDSSDMEYIVLAEVVGVGTSAYDIAYSGYLPEANAAQVCAAYNRISENNLDMNDLPSNASFFGYFHEGDFSNGDIFGDDSGEEAVEGVTAACFLDGSDYAFYYIIAKR